MSAQQAATVAPASTPRRRRILRVLAVVAAVVVPLAFAGLALAAFSKSDGLDRIPAAIVNDDQFVTQTAPDGTESPILAGRLLVTQLTGEDSPGMEWQLSNADDAAAMLASGEVYAVLTIPSDFSASVVSLSGSHPQRAQLRIQTDDAHSYLAGTVAQSLGDGMARAFGSELTEQFISGIFAQIGTVGEAFTEASDGAAQLADGAADAASGAKQYAGGVSSYTAGVQALSSGLDTMNQQTAELGQLGAGVAGYTDGVSQLSGGLGQLAQAMAADPRFTSDPTLAPYLAQLQQLSGGLDAVAQNGPALAAGASGLGALATGIAQSADGAAQLAANSGQLTTGAQQLADGTALLAEGASELATGLEHGADQLNGAELPGPDAASVAADPVGLEVTTENAVGGVGQVISTYFVPLGLWLGALAIFLVMPRLSRRVLSSTARTSRVLGSEAVRTGAVAAVQALLLAVLLHSATGEWAHFPATLGVALVAALAFTAFHQLLTVGLGRAGLVISLLLLGVQFAAVGGIVPSEALAAPFAGIASLSPLGWASTALQQIATGGEAGRAIGAVVALAAFGAVSLLVSRLVMRRARRASVLGMLLPQAG